MSDQDEAHYKANLQYPRWPGGESGVVIGFDYDLGDKSVEQFYADWQDHFHSMTTLERLSRVCGKRGAEAEEVLLTVVGLLVPFSAAVSAENVDVPIEKEADPDVVEQP